MNSSKPDNNDHSNLDGKPEPLSNDDHYANVYLNKPINGREYLKLLVYCVAGLLGIGIAIGIVFNLID